VQRTLIKSGITRLVSRDGAAPSSSTKIMKITACPHTDRKYRARGMCNSCYLKSNGGSKRWYQKNKQLAKDRAEIWAKKNKNRRKEISRVWSRKDYEENKSKWLGRNKESRKNNINHRISHNLRSRINKALKGIDKAQSTISLLGCSIEDFRKHIENQFREGMNWDNYGSWHVDHIRPCASFDLRDKDQQKICFHYTNLQPLWAFENQSKGAA
jgi:hypothetical protein